MKASKSSRVLDIAMLCLSLILAIGVATVFRPCAAKEDGSWMNCHYAGRNVMWVGIALCVVSLIRLFAKGGRLAFDIIALLLAVLAMLIPGTLMHLCMMDTMRCVAVMKPAVTVFSALIAAVAAIDGGAAVIEKKK